MANTDLTVNRSELNITRLAIDQGVSRTTIRRWLEDGWTPPTVEVLPPEPTTPSTTPSTPSTPVDMWWTRVFLRLVATGIAGLALGINVQLGWRFGTTLVKSVTFAGIAAGADLLALILPATATGLWQRERPLMSTLAWTMWTGVVAMAMLASLGFVELHTGDTAAGRQAIVTSSASLTTQRDERIAAAKTAVANAITARDQECNKVGDNCRRRVAELNERQAELSAAIAAPVPTAAPIADADPQVTGALRLATWAGLSVKTNDVVNLRLALMAILPNLAGLLFAFAMGLAQPARRSR